MKSKIFSKVLSLALLTTIALSASEQSSSAPSSENAQETQIHLSAIELQEIFNNPTRSYVYIGKEVSDLANVIAEISKLEDNQESAVWGLVNHIEKGFVIGHYDAIAQALEEAELTLNKHAATLDVDRAAELSRSLNNIIEQVVEERLSLDADLLSFLKDQVTTNEDATKYSRGLRLLVINEKVDFLGKAKFREDVTFYDDVKFKDDVKFEDEVVFEDNVTIEGTLSTCDVVVGCNILMNDSISPAIGNVVKNGITFIQNFGTNNTFVGDNAGNFTSTGTDNAGFGTNALANNNDIQLVAVGSGALQNYTTSAAGFGTSNSVAVGYNALNANIAGNSNTAVGWSALSLDVTTTTGNNTGLGWGALQLNTTGVNNTAVGNSALNFNTTGIDNTAIGNATLEDNLTGNNNTAVGHLAQQHLVAADNNTAVGSRALRVNLAGSNNTALGTNALTATTGVNNIAIGFNAGVSLTTGNNNIYIGADAVAAGESNVTRIGGIRGATTVVADAIAVLIDSTGQLGTINSTRRVKHNIADMNNDSAAIYNLRPVTFAYNGDASETKQYGLIAEEADEVFPAIVVHDADGQPQTIQYHVLPALMLNELQKLAARVAALEARA